MSERIDRSIATGRQLLVTILILILVTAAAGSYVWLRLARPSPAPSEVQPVPVQSMRSADVPLAITVYIPGDLALSPRSMAIKRQPDVQTQAKEALDAYLADQKTGQSPVLKDLKLRGFFLDPSGTAYVDLTQAPPNGVKGSVQDEMLGLYAIVNTLTQNFEEIKQVRFLIEGKEARTLTGHIDLSKKFTKRPDLVKQ